MERREPGGSGDTAVLAVCVVLVAVALATAGSAVASKSVCEADSTDCAARSLGDAERLVLQSETAITAGPFALVAAAVVGALALLATIVGGRVLARATRRPQIPVVSRDPEPILSDRDRIVLLLERRGGRMRQRHIVEQVEWSKAKVSRLLSALEEEGVVRKLSLGRENLVYLEGRTPFDDDERSSKR